MVNEADLSARRLWIGCRRDVLELNHHHRLSSLDWRIAKEADLASKFVEHGSIQSDPSVSPWVADDPDGVTPFEDRADSAQLVVENLAELLEVIVLSVRLRGK